MVQPQAAARFGLPLSLFTYDPALTTQLNQALYQVSVSGAQPTATGLVLAPAAITFHYAANGLDVVKTFRFDSSYVVTVEAEVKRNGAPVRALVAWPAGLGDMEELQPTSMMPSQTRTPSFFAWSIDGKQDSQAAAKVSGNNTLDEPYQYAAVMDLYFASAFLPDVPERTTVVTLHNAIDLPGDPSDPNSKKTPVDVLGLAVGDTSGDTRLRLFAGPKATDVLKSIHAIGADGKPDGPSLEPLIQFGCWAFIAKPLYLLLRFMVQHGIGNWGWAIILSTVIFNLMLLPTRFMMTKSSLKMMRIQPKVDAIKKRYANLKMNDPKRAEMNTEMMALYKTEGVNMYGGCLPMLLQMLLLRLLPRAAERGGAAPGPLALAARSLAARPDAHSAHLHHRHHVPDPVHHALAGHGSLPAPHDGLHDADLLRLHALALRLGTGALLGHRQHHHAGHADRHQPLALGQGDARHRRPPRREKEVSPITGQGRR